MYRDTSSVDCAPRELTHACLRELCICRDSGYFFSILTSTEMCLYV